MAAPTTPAPAPLGRRPRPDGTLAPFVLGAPGTFLETRQDVVVIGNRPGTFHRIVVAAVVGIGVLLAVSLWGTMGAWALAPLFVFGLPSLLVLANAQRYEVTRGRLEARGRSLGRRFGRGWALPPESVVRVGTRWEMRSDAMTQWIFYQVQLRIQGGWVTLAESSRPDAVRALAKDVAAAAAVPMGD